MTIEAELFDGTVLEFPDGTDPQVIQRVVKQQTMQRRQAAEAAPFAADFSPVQAPPRVEVQEAAAAQPQPAAPRTWLQRADGLGAALFDGMRQGAASLVGTPVDLVNNAPRLANLLPGVDGVGPISANPIGGRDTVDKLLRLGGVIPDYQPQDGIERVVNRVGEELGASAVPVVGAIGRAATMPVATVNRMAAMPRSVGEGLAAQFLQPAAVNPVGLAGREALYATGAGMGAGLATEAFGDGPLVDMGGSIAGTLATAAASGLTGALRNVAAGATGNTKFADDVAQAAVADRLINSSSDMQAQAARLADAGAPPEALSTDSLVSALRSPSAAEDLVPDYRANIADRARDPGLATMVYNADTRSPGAANTRIAGNNAAVDARIAGMTPDGDPARFRAALQTGVDQQIAGAGAQVDQARTVFDDIEQALQPTMREASARGSAIRSALQDAYDAAQTRVRGMYGQLDDRTTLLDPTDLVERGKGVDMNLAPNDAKRFRPVEAGTIQEMMPGDRAPLRDTGLVNEFNRPIFAANPPGPANPSGVPALPGEAVGRPGTTVPLSDVTAIRTGLTDDLRAAQAAGNTQQARVLGKYVDAIDTYLDDALPEGMRTALDDARAARRDVGERFERPGTALESVLARREGGGFAMDDSAVPSRFAQPDQGRLSDLKAALREAGGDVRLRDGLADEVRSDVTRRGLLDNPKALGKYMADRQVLLGEFPELRAQLEQAGATRATLTEAERAAAETTKRLTTPGRSPEATYLARSVEDPGQAIRAVTNSQDPRKAVADLVATANSPQAKLDLRTALWEEVKRTGRLQADDMTGGARWNAKKLRAAFDDPKFSAVAEELWADDPQDLANIKQVFDALAGAEGSMRARAPNASGTAQALAGGYDPALSMASIASRGRSVSRGQLSPTIAAVDILGTWLRRRSAMVQSRAIDQLTAAVVNNPGLAADLLEKYNPATAAARRAMLTQKHGVRATQIINLLDEAEDEDPVVDALQGGR